MNLWGRTNVKFDLSNYETKTDLKQSTGVDMSNLAKKSELAIVKTKEDKIDAQEIKIYSC